MRVKFLTVARYCINPTVGSPADNRDAPIRV